MSPSAPPPSEQSATATPQVAVASVYGRRGTGPIVRLGGGSLMAPALVIADTQLADALNAHRRPRTAPFAEHHANALALVASGVTPTRPADPAAELSDSVAARPKPPAPPLPPGLVILRVGVGWVASGTVHVEVIDVKQTLISDQRFGADDWGFELVTASRGPWQGQPPPGPGPHPVPASVWCVLFPWASFCNT